MAVTVDEAGNNEPVGGKRPHVEIARGVAHAAEVAGGRDAPVPDGERVIFSQLPAHQGPRAANEFGDHVVTPLLKTAAARLPPNCQPNSSGDSSCNATKSAGAPTRRTPGIGAQRVRRRARYAVERLGRR